MLLAALLFTLFCLSDWLLLWALPYLRISFALDFGMPLAVSLLARSGALVALLGAAWLTRWRKRAATGAPQSRSAVWLFLLINLTFSLVQVDAYVVEPLRVETTELALAKIELNRARENRRVAQANLELAQSQLALRTIASPIDGVVVDRYVMVGESVEGRSIMKLAQVDPLKVELIAPTEYFGLIRGGMEVQVYPEQPVGEAFTATVTIVDQLIDPASGSFTVRMELPNPDDRLVGGVNCRARFGFETPQPVSGGPLGGSSTALLGE